MLKMSTGLAETCHFIFDRIGTEDDSFLVGLLEPYKAEMKQLCASSMRHHLMSTAGKTVNLERLKRALVDVDLFTQCSEEMP
jgi:hypothetical protein